MTQPQDRLELEWQPEKRDYDEGFQALNRANRATVKLLMVVGTVTVLLTVLGAARGGAGEAVGTAVPLIVVGVVIAVVMPRMLVRGFWRRSPRVRSATRATVEPATGIEVTTEQSSVEHPWDSIQDILETERIFVVRLKGYRGRAFFPLAKRGLKDDGDVDRLRTLLRDHASQTADER